MTPRIITPATPVIDVARARLHCKIDGAERDDELVDAIETARAWAQAHLQVAIGEQVLEFTQRTWCGSVKLPYDVTTLISVTAAGVDVTGTAIVTDRTVAAVGIAPVVIQIATGYSASRLPSPIKSAMLLLIADLVVNQQAQSVNKLYENPAVENLLSLYRERLSL